MHETTLLRDLVLLVAVAVPIVVVAQRLRIPSIVGFLLTGVAIGPHALGLISDDGAVQRLSEIGVVLLLFAVGLELSLARVRQLGRAVLQGGALQMAGTITAVAIVAVLAGMPAREAAFIGALVAVSSTAVVLGSYTARDELDTPHGRVVVAISVFQDLAVVPLMLLVPLLAGVATGAGAALRQIVLSLVVIGLLVAFGRFVVPWLLDQVVRARSRELFTLAIVVVGLGAAYVVSLFGVSLALGAFVAGLVVSESEFGLQALSDVLPFRDVFGGIFFAAVGMLLDLDTLAGAPVFAVGVALGVIALKAVIGAGAVATLGRTVQTSVIAGLGLAQVGEFSFILAEAGRGSGLLDVRQFQLFLAASVLSMVLAPLLIAQAAPIADGVGRVFGLLPRSAEPAPAPAYADHVIIIGYGLNGANVARALRAVNVPYVVLEQNGQSVRRAREAGEPIVFGDGTRPEVLERVGIHHAKVLAFCIAAPADERRGVAIARTLNPRARIIVRTRYVREIVELQRLGADEVVPEEFETSLEIFARTLRHYGIPSTTIRREVERVRQEHYDMFTGRERPLSALTGMHEAVGVKLSVDTVEVEAGARAAGENPLTLALRKSTGATVVAVIRGGNIFYEPDPDFAFVPGDGAVLVGRPDAIQRATAMFRAAPPDR